jgi:ketosteroid isomerase-like protein
MSDKTDVDVQTNVGVVQQAYEAFVREDISAVLESLTDDVEWTMQGPSVIPFSGTFRGREGIAEFFGLLDETMEIEQFETRKFVGQGDTVVVLGYERDVVKQTGRGFEEEWAHVYTLRDGKIATGLFLENTAAFVEALSAG